MEKYIGTIANINNKYVVLNDKRFINETELFKSLLPNDIVEYNICENKINIIKIIQRKEQIILGIIKEIGLEKSIICCPSLPKFFSIEISTQNNFQLFSVILLKISLNNIDILNIYDSIKNRKNDKYIFINLYEEYSKLCNILPIYKQSKSYYTDDFKDLTHLYTFNVDPTESKDFDDAISIDENENKIYVHIVDANEQIEQMSNIDINSLKDSFTLYLPEHVRNILPSNMAENKLSLIEGQERKTITVEYLIDDKTQNIIGHSVYKSIIKIKKRYDYDEFNKSLYNFQKLLLFYKRWKRQTLNIPNVKLNINKIDGKLTNYKLENNVDDAHKIIETMMILTNLTISEHIGSLIPQRYHSKLKSEFELKSFTNNNIIDSILSIKKFKPAIYDSLNSGHFGLGLKTYTHFTSPIRRYFDVIIHRLLSGTTYENIDEILNHINNKELYVEKLIEIYNNLKFLTYFEDNLNKIWSAYILSITNNGITVILEDNLYELFLFETNKNFNIYDKVNIKIKNINWLNLNVKAIII